MRVIFAVVLLTLSGSTFSEAGNPRNISEEDLERILRSITVGGHPAAAVMIRFTVPEPGSTHVVTIHGYGARNLEVCEDLIAPYNADPSLSVIQSNTYHCELLQ